MGGRWQVAASTGSIFFFFSFLISNGTAFAVRQSELGQLTVFGVSVVAAAAAVAVAWRNRRRTLFSQKGLTSGLNVTFLLFFFVKRDISLAQKYSLQHLLCVYSVFKI